MIHTSKCGAHTHTFTQVLFVSRSQFTADIYTVLLPAVYSHHLLLDSVSARRHRCAQTVF